MLIITVPADVLAPDGTGHLAGTEWLKDYSDVIMNTMASQISSLSIVYSTVSLGAD